MDTSGTDSPLPDDPATRDLAASLLPEYSVIRILGAGGMGTVYLAREPGLRRLVAVKIISSQLATLDPLRLRFEREARAAALVSHPNVVQVYRVGTTRELGLPFIVMEYVEGKSLKDVIDTGVLVREQEARRILGALAGALAGAHHHGLVHRDVKPANVLIQDKTERLYLTDFGVAGALEPETLGEETTLTDSGLRVGTPRYMSPEQAAGEKTGPEGDVYSLGVLAFELLTGKPPFSAPSAALLAAAHVMTSPPSLANLRPDLQPDMVRLIDACLAKAPADRPTATQVALELVPSLHDLPEWPPADLSALLGQGAIIARWAAIIGVATILVAIGLAFPPRVVQATGEWWSRFESEARIATGSTSGVRRIAASGQGIFVWTWGVLLVLSSAIVSLGTLALLWRGGALLPVIRLARLDRPATLLPDLLSDSDGSGGNLRHEQQVGHGKEAARRLLLLRRRKTALLLAGGTGLGLLLMAWCLALAGGLIATPTTGSLISFPVLTVLALPAALLAAGLAAAVRESRWREGISAAGRPSTRAPRVRTPVPSTWLSWIAVGCGIAGVAGLATGTASTLLAARSVLRFGPPTAELADTIQSLRNRDPIREAAAEWRRRIGNPTPQDSVANALVIAEPPPGSPERLVDALGANAREEPVILATLRRTRASLSADTLQLLDRFAATTPKELGPADDPQAASSLMHWNILTALRARAREDWAGAMSALGRNAAAAEGLWSSIDPFLVRAGAGRFENLALAPAALIAELQGDSGGARALRAIGATVRGYLTLPVWEIRMLGFAGDASDFGVLRRAAATPAIPLAFRRASLEGIRDGFCLSPGEVLAGPSPRRSQAVAEVAGEMGLSPDDPFPAEITSGLTGLSGNSPGRIAARLHHCVAVGR